MRCGSAGEVDGLWTVDDGIGYEVECFSGKGSRSGGSVYLFMSGSEYLWVESFEGGGKGALVSCLNDAFLSWC